jgi:peptide deformylase
MAVREICRMGNPILRKVADKVEVAQIKTDEFKQLIQDMHESMVHYGGVGIAAPQIGVSVQVCLIDIEPDNERYETDEATELTVFINPVVTPLTEETKGFWEGCLSVPGLRGYVERPTKVKVEYINIDGEQVTVEYDGFNAIVIQHELDHLFGKIYLDRITDNTKISYNEEFDQFIMPTLSEEEA